MHKSTLCLPLAACALLAGCAENLVAPDKLAAPAALTCIQLPEEVIATDHLGLMKTLMQTHLERGPYVSEKEDALGTYYRGPKGAVSMHWPDNPSSKPGHVDGGFFIPKDPQKLPSVYFYTSMDTVEPEVPGPEVSCANVGYIKDPVTQKLSVGWMAAAGGLGGAAGRAAVPRSSVSYGQAAAGGAIAGALVGYLVNMDMGKIKQYDSVKDPVALGKLRELSAQAVPVTPLPAGADASAASAPR